RRSARGEAPAGGRKAHPPGGGGGGADEVLEPLPHLRRRLVRERDREDLRRLGADRGEQVRDPAGEDAGLPRAGAGDDEERALGGEDSLPLSRIQVLEV